MDFAKLRHYLPEQDLMLLGKTPVVYHCQHFNLFLDQTIDDALGPTDGAELRLRAAHEAAYPLIKSVCAAFGASTPAERAHIAERLFSVMGHGTLQADATATGGQALGHHLHYGYAWREKYGERVRRLHPVDGFAAGYAAAAAEVSANLPCGSLVSKETSCIALRAPHCEFKIIPAATGVECAARAPVEAEEYLANTRRSFGGKHETQITEIADGLKQFTAGVAGDERGLVQAFGVLVTMHLTGYYNRISYDAVKEIQRVAPQSVGVLEDLLRESGHVCVFRTFGGILLSPEWEAMVGAPGEDPEQVVVGCLAIARALGFGHWTLAEFAPGKRLVVRTSSTYESADYLTRYGTATSPNEYFFQGAALAIMQLAHRVSWRSRPELTSEYYDELFRKGVPWTLKQTSCIACGDDVSEVIISAKD
ncbi:MAG: hypothetical protein R3B07_15110 [Polyangiaceae bacterium]